MDKLLVLALEAARLAGRAILPHYQQTLSIAHKQDRSLLTLADQAAHQAIVSHLARSGLFIISEESDDLHLDAERYWLVDPLESTKDFLAGNGEFTVNIALVYQGRPVLGVVFTPVLCVVYWGAEGSGAGQDRGWCAAALLPPAKSPACRMAVSRFHDRQASRHWLRNQVRFAGGSRSGCVSPSSWQLEVGYSRWPGHAGGCRQSGFGLANRQTSGVWQLTT